MVVHQGVLALKHTFDETWEFIKNRRGIDLITLNRGTLFEAEAKITTRGKHKGNRVIIFYQKEEEYARSYPCCWGHVHNCNDTWIGMYCKAVDVFIP